MDAKNEHLTTTRERADPGGYSDIDGMVVDALDEAIGQMRRDTLLRRRSVSSVLNAEKELATSGVGEAHTIAREFAPIPPVRLKGEDAEGLFVECGAFEHGRGRF